MVHLRRFAVVLVAIAAGALAVSCSDDDTVETSTDTSAATTEPTAPGPDDSLPVDDLPEGCERVPATTAAGMPGGGEIVCDSPGSPGALPGEAPVTTVEPWPDVEIPPGQGVAQISIIGSPCSRSRPDQPCVLIAEMLTGTVQITPSDGGEPTGLVITESGEAMPPGSGWIALDPGDYRVTATPEQPDRVCEVTSATITAGQPTDVVVSCMAP